MTEGKNLRWYIDGKPITEHLTIPIGEKPDNDIKLGKTFSITLPNDWEYYMKRKDTYYFRRFGEKLKVEINPDNKGNQNLNHLKYGDKLEIEYSLKD